MNELARFKLNLDPDSELPIPIDSMTIGEIRNSIADAITRAYVSGPCGHIQVKWVNTGQPRAELGPTELMRDVNNMLCHWILVAFEVRPAAGKIDRRHWFPCAAINECARCAAHFMAEAEAVEGGAAGGSSTAPTVSGAAETAETGEESDDDIIDLSVKALTPSKKTCK